MTDDLQQLRDANEHLTAVRRNLIVALGGNTTLADAYRDALAARLRATCYGWGHLRVVPEDIATIVDWAAIEVERDVRLA